MFSNLPLRHQYGFIAAGGLALVGVFGFGGHYLRQPAPIVATPLRQAPPVVRPAQKVAQEPEQELSPVEVVVHVAGAVKNPTVVTVHPGDRVHDAIRLAGGALPNADLSRVNLAARLQDGSQLFIPYQRDTKPTEVALSYQGGEAKSPYAITPSSGPKIVNLNSGSLAELDTLPGIGPTTAQKILDYRQANGPFQSVEELLTISGIGTAMLERIRPFVVL